MDPVELQSIDYDPFEGNIPPSGVLSQASAPLPVTTQNLPPPTGTDLLRNKFMENQINNNGNLLDQTNQSQGIEDSVRGFGAPVPPGHGDRDIALQPVDHNPFSFAGLLSQFNPISSAHAEEQNPISAAMMQHPILTPNAPGPGLVAGPLGAAPGAAPIGRIPQRLPTSTRNPLDQGGNIDLPSMKADPKLFQKNTDLLRNYPNMTAEESQLPSDQLADVFIGHVKDNLLWLHDQVPEDIRQRSSMWYEGGNNIIKDWVQKFSPQYPSNQPPLTNESVAGVIAAMSPQKDWYQNVSLAHRVLDIYQNKANLPMTPEQEAWFKGSTLDKPEYQPLFDTIRGKSLQDIRDMDLPADEKSVLQAMWIRTHDEAHNSRDYNEVTPEGGFGDVVRNEPTKTQRLLGQPGKPSGVGWGSLTEIGKAVRSIESGGDPAVLSQVMGERHKVRNFYNNLLDPNSPLGDTTIDTHAVAAGLLRPLSGNSLEVSHNFNNYAGKGQPGSSGSAITGVQGTYPLYAEAYRQAAAERGILPRQMQSITWEAVRGLFPESFKTAKNNDLVNTQWLLYRSGKQSLDDTRSNISNLAGGINPPSWHRPAAETNAAVQNPSNAGELPQPQSPGQASGAVPGGGNPAGAQVSPQWSNLAPQHEAIVQRALAEMQTKNMNDGRVSQGLRQRTRRELVRAGMDDNTAYSLTLAMTGQGPQSQLGRFAP